jgi:ribosomal protein S18 acetylase RimI-like enzyme
MITLLVGMMIHSEGGYARKSQPLCDKPELRAILNNLAAIATNTNIDIPEQTLSTAIVCTSNCSQLATLDRFEIRAVSEQEIDRVADIITHSFHFDRGWMSWFTPIFKLGIAEDLRYRIRSSAPERSHRHQLPQPICSIATCTDSGRSYVVGTIEVGARNARDRLPRNRYAYISNLAVSKEWRRRGVAQELLAECERIAAGWGYKELYLHVLADNERGRNLYQKLGYELVSTDVARSFIPWYRPQQLFLRKQI